MKIWILTAKEVRDLDTWVCYCDEDPVQLLYNNDEYLEVLNTILDDLYYSFGEGTIEFPEDWDELDEEEQEDIYTEHYNEWCDNISFESYEVDSPEDFEVLIDLRL